MRTCTGSQALSTVSSSLDWFWYAIIQIFSCPFHFAQEAVLEVLSTLTKQGAGPRHQWKPPEGLDLVKPIGEGNPRGSLKKVEDRNVWEASKDVHHIRRPWYASCRSLLHWFCPSPDTSSKISVQGNATRCQRLHESSSILEAQNEGVIHFL